MAGNRSWKLLKLTMEEAKVDDCEENGERASGEKEQPGGLWNKLVKLYTFRL